MRPATLLIAPGLLLALTGAVTAARGAESGVSVERGRYIAMIGGCNDCHTAGYARSGGQVPQAQWLLGSDVGFAGPWGTTYPSNLRLFMRDLSEDEWVGKAKKMETRPPMPWFNVRAMHEADLRSLYRFVRSLGPAGQPAPDFVSPGKQPTHPFVVFAPPQMPEK